MANEMPPADSHAGLSRKVLQYGEGFLAIVNKLKLGPLTDADWAPIESLVDTAAYQRVGVFMGLKAEVIDWPTYRSYVTAYAAATTWEGTLRRITETPGRVILELEERNGFDGKTDVSNTVTIYEFDAAEKLVHLDVYVMPLP